ncbi:hypothetical protein CH373_14745 [Leptospira perolatii]|uniref:Uncharacterized protein n=1 Tax=Leptospira perolatii TaxID=2023191 RepID=A0A2M9ZKE4_9LEPT|nr:hypothetical protein [Leptospira perolatii]PJZ69215.1 hypothetical protein CH360_11875 [Leptospira perolatii]PJZ72403.1 hypothetical protein CH373_14745 [Leptospira perolatii]
MVSTSPKRPLDSAKVGKIALAIILGTLVGAVAGVILDHLLGLSFFSKGLLKEAFSLELYVIKVEIQFTPASLFGLVATLFFVLKKG